MSDEWFQPISLGHKEHKETMRASWFNRASPEQKITFLQELEVGYVREINLQASRIERQQSRILELEAKLATPIYTCLMESIKETHEHLTEFGVGKEECRLPERVEHFMEEVRKYVSGRDGHWMLEEEQDDH